MRQSVTTKNRGSALIAVVALLMILALMGVAYLVVVRTDRQATFATGAVSGVGAFPAANPASLDAAQTVAADLVRRNIVGALTRSLTTTPLNYRDPTPDNVNHTEYPSLFDYPGTSTFLASRYPESRVLLGAGDAAGATRAYWPFITAPLVDPADTANLAANLANLRLESPLDLAAGPAPAYPAAAPPPYPGAISTKAADILYDTTLGAHIRATLRPGSVPLTYPAGFVAPALLAGKTRVFPAFVDAGNNALYLAADASGAGIADSALFRLDVTPESMTWPDGNHPVTFWAAVRIVDNNAAVNLNTAWRTLDKDFGAGAGANIAAAAFENGLLGAFRANVSLETLGATGWDMTTLETLRFGQAARPSDIPMKELTRTTRADYTFGTQGDAMENQLARRLTNPGWLDSAHRYAILPLTDSTGLAYQSGLYNPSVPQSQTEQTFSWSAVNRAPNFATSPTKVFSFYPSNADDIWFNTAYNDDNAVAANQRTPFLSSATLVPTYSGAASGVPPLGLRSMVVTSNPLTTSTAPHNNLGIPVLTAPNAMTALDTGTYKNARKVSVNTAPFGDLWRAFWDVMCNDTVPTFPSDGGLTTVSRAGDRMFRSSLRYPAPPIPPAPQNGTFFTAQYEMYLRSAVAAVNTIAMRSPVAIAPQPLSSGMQATINDVANTPVKVEIPALRAQPYITEVYADNNNGTLLNGTQRNTNGYVAIEIHNPSSAAISLAGIRLVSYARGATGLTYTAGSDVNKLLTTLTGCPASLASGGFIVIESAFQFRPQSAGGTPPGIVLSCPDLDRVTTGRELFLLQSTTFPAEPSTPNDAGWVALDAYDFSGFPQADWSAGAGTKQNVTAWHYLRQTKTATPKSEWRCVYPGRYEPSRTPRQEGTQTRTWQVTLDAITEEDPGLGSNPFTDKDAPGRGTAAGAVSLGKVNPDASYLNTFRIPLVDPKFALPNAVPVNPKNKFPFGGFARDGDMLQIPFIGNYTVRDKNDTGYIELVPVTMDAAFADDGDDTATQYPTGAGPTNNEMEQIGRFCSMQAFDSNYTGTDRYAWSNKVFDYLTTIHNPKDDTNPNVDATSYAAGGGTPAPEPVLNDVNVLPANEDLIPVHGLININTASWQVLATVPWVRLGDATVTAANMADINRRIAKAIVRYRDIDGDVAAGIQPPHGAFHSIVELNQVPIYTAAELNDTGANLAFPAAAGPVTGDFSQSLGELSSGALAAGDGLADSYKEHFLVLTRVSNLLTTRSDSFTAYILIQAWQDAGTKFPVLLGERRSAYIFDRQAPTTPTFLVPTALKETSVATN